MALEDMGQETGVYGTERRAAEGRGGDWEDKEWGQTLGTQYEVGDTREMEISY